MYVTTFQRNEFQAQKNFKTAEPTIYLNCLNLLTFILSLIVKTSGDLLNPGSIFLFLFSSLKISVFEKVPVCCFNELDLLPFHFAGSYDGQSEQYDQLEDGNDQYETSCYF